MSKIKVGIERYMDGPLITGSIIISSFMFPPEFIGFQGHFPANKVLPGACQIQCVISTIEKALEKRLILKEILLAKYIAPVMPGDKVTCTVSGVSDAGSEFIYKACIAKDAVKIADFKLRVCLSDAI